MSLIFFWQKSQQTLPYKNIVNLTWCLFKQHVTIYTCKISMFKLIQLLVLINEIHSILAPLAYRLKDSNIDFE